MICRFCKHEIDDNSIFCKWCGERQVKERKKKTEIKVPKPTKLPSGKWNIYLRAEGQSITEDTDALCVAKAKAIRAGFMEAQKKLPKYPLKVTLLNFINESNGILSPSTLRGYRQIANGRFVPYADKDITRINWQKAVNDEAKLCSPKTVHNAWGFVSRVMRSNKITVPDIVLPQVPVKELPWLNYEQIRIFLEAIYGTSIEMAALFALHSLRRSELLAITPEKIQEDGIHVSGARVHDDKGRLVDKDTNKNRGSTRVVPIMIPRLQELIDTADAVPGTPYVTIWPNNIFDHINRICRKNGLPEVGFHGLRRSFASLAYHLGWQERKTMAIGGWSDFQTMHKMYIKLDGRDLEDAAESMRNFYKLQTDLQMTSKT